MAVVWVVLKGCELCYFNVHADYYSRIIMILFFQVYYNVLHLQFVANVQCSAVYLSSCLLVNLIYLFPLILTGAEN